MTTSFKTPKGSELPIMNLKGKDYLQVAHRVIWFREEKPDWAIETEIVSSTENDATVKATIKDSGGRAVASAHKTCDANSFKMGFVEKAETGAIGRALALCGYGTQFASEIVDDDTDGNLADAPLERAERPAKPSPAADLHTVAAKAKAKTAAPSSGSMADYVPTFGKYKGQKIGSISAEDLMGYIEYIERSSKEQGKTPSGAAADFIHAAKSHLSKSQDLENIPF